MADERALEGRVEAAHKKMKNEAVAEPTPQDMQKALIEQREMERKAKYDAVVAKAKERGLTEEGLIEKVHSAYRAYADKLDFQSIMGVWDATEVSPLPIYMEILRRCESVRDFLYYGEIFKANSRSGFKYPAELIQKHAQKLLDEKDTDSFIGFLYCTTTKPGEVEITGMIQDGYAKLAVDSDNRYRMRNLIRVTNIAPDAEAMKQAASKMQSEGRYAEVRSLMLMLEKEVPKQRYCLHDGESALDSLLGKSSQEF